MEALTLAWAAAQGWIFETLVVPAVFALGLSTHMELAFEATEVVMVGAVEIALLWLALSALERWRPVERWADRRAVRADVIYTFLHRLGLAPLAFFLILTPAVDGFEGWLRLQGFVPTSLEDWAPGLHAHPFAAFLVYLVVLDFVAYWLHRGQHAFEWWWALHSLHHSQREMTFWADDRNHLLDDAVVDVCYALVALAIGVPPEQFVLIVLGTRAVESLSHVNARIGFGRWGERVLVSPRFHRAHHAIGIGHEGVHRGCNFAVLFPAWDHLFGTADSGREFHPTGIRDQLAGRDYGEGFWRQQWLGLARLAAALRPAASPFIPQSRKPQ